MHGSISGPQNGSGLVPDVLNLTPATLATRGFAVVGNDLKQNRKMAVCALTYCVRFKEDKQLALFLGP